MVTEFADMALSTLHAIDRDGRATFTAPRHRPGRSSDFYGTARRAPSDPTSISRAIRVGRIRLLVRLVVFEQLQPGAKDAR
jgi:hypothetical protein